MLVRVKKHPTLGILVASNGMVFNRVRGSNTYKWTFGSISSSYGRRLPYARIHTAGRIYPVHRLVAETFLPNPEGKTQVDHILRDSLDNNVCQIRWATPTENVRNRTNTTEFAELLVIDKNMYQRVWHNKKREAGFHRVKGADGKLHYEKILNEKSPSTTAKKKCRKAVVG